MDCRLAFITPLLFKASIQTDGHSKPWYQCIPRFIVWFILVIFLNTYIFSNASLLGNQAVMTMNQVGSAINNLSKHIITLSLFFIGASLTRDTLKSVGLRPFIQGILLWVSISIISLSWIMW